MKKRVLISALAALTIIAAAPAFAADTGPPALAKGSHILALTGSSGIAAGHPIAIPGQALAQSTILAYHDPMVCPSFLISVPFRAPTAIITRQPGILGGGTMAYSKPAMAAPIVLASAGSIAISISAREMEMPSMASGLSSGGGQCIALQIVLSSNVGYENGSSLSAG